MINEEQLEADVEAFYKAMKEKYGINAMCVHMGAEHSNEVHEVLSENITFTRGNVLTCLGMVWDFLNSVKRRKV